MDHNHTFHNNHDNSVESLSRNAVGDINMECLLSPEEQLALDHRIRESSHPTDSELSYYQASMASATALAAPDDLAAEILHAHEVHLDEAYLRGYECYEPDNFFCDCAPYYYIPSPPEWMSSP